MEGGGTSHGSPYENLRVPGGGSDAKMDDGEVDPRLGRRWRYGKSTQWPASPPQANADVGQFLSTLTARLWMGTP